MTRTDDDSWDITESVGATALGVAAGRAAESDSTTPLIDDPYARMFLDAAGQGMWSMFSPSSLPADIAVAEPDLPVRMQSMVDYIASRTAFFDEFFLDATRAGLRQVVVLAAGLDARAWRLPWPDNTTVYELDQPKVLEFKAATLAEHGAPPPANRVEVAVDLRQDWPAALQQAGFDATAPSVWSAEGLLPYLPAAAQDLLFERVQSLSAVGSRIAVEAPGPDFNDPDARARQRALMQRYQQVAVQVHGAEVPDVGDLLYFEDRADVSEWLRDHGWQSTAVPAEQLMARYNRHTPHEIKDSIPDNLFVSAERT